MMKRPAAALIVLSCLTLALAGFAPAAHAGYGWGEDEGRSNQSGGFWSNSSSRYPSSAEISQALYGTPPEPYDTPEEQSPLEVTQAG